MSEPSGKQSKYSKRPREKGSAMSVLHLQHQRSDGEQDTFHLKNVRRYHLGRGSACELRILDMKMSRQHCAFEYHDGQWVIVDLGSTNGATVNDQRIDGSTALHAGQVIKAGGTQLCVISISDHVDLLPESLVNLDDDDESHDSAAVEQETMPPVSEEIPIPANENSWDGEPLDSPPEHEHQATVAIERKQSSADHPTSATPNRASRPIRTPIPEPANALPFQDGDALQQRPEERTPLAFPEADQSDAAPSSEANPPQRSPEPTRPATDSQPAAPSTAAVDKQPSRSTSGDGMIITLLGRRIGPIDRDTARELKKKHILGTLTEADLKSYPDA